MDELVAVAADHHQVFQLCSHRSIQFTERVRVVNVKEFFAGIDGINVPTVTGANFAEQMTMQSNEYATLVLTESAAPLDASVDSP